jgi:hypothetical protein
VLNKDVVEKPKSSKKQKKIDFQLVQSKDAIFKHGLFEKKEKKYRISLKGFRALLFYVICVDSKKELIEHENPNFSLKNINEFISCFDLRNMSSDIFLESKFFIEFISRTSKFGICTLKKDEINKTWYISEKT